MNKIIQSNYNQLSKYNSIETKFEFMSEKEKKASEMANILLCKKDWNSMTYAEF